MRAGVCIPYSQRKPTRASTTLSHLMVSSYLWKSHEFAVHKGVLRMQRRNRFADRHRPSVFPLCHQTAISKYNNMSAPVQSAARQAGPALTRVLAHFPEVSYAFAYGSGAHHQPGLYDATEPLHSPSEAQSTSGDERTERPGTGLASTRTAPTPGAAAGGKAQGKGPVLDFVFAVQDAHKWHEEVGRQDCCSAWGRRERACPLSARQ